MHFATHTLRGSGAIPYFIKEGDKMSNIIIVADAANTKIDRIIKTLEKTKGIPNVSFIIEILESIKIWDIKINTDHEVYVVFKDQEIKRIN